LIDRWHDPRGLIEDAKKHKGRVLILTPWQAWADTLGKELDAPVLHAGITPTAAWNGIRAFAGGTDGIIVATRIGAWLSLFADRILLDEPENDDYKQDELSPRLDARWIVAETTALRSGLTLTAFGTTPRLGTIVDDWTTVPDINLPLSVESHRGHGKSDVDGLSTAALTKIEEAINGERSVVVLHPVRGERARITCHDCGWQAICPSCSFPVSLMGGMALCRRCGKKSNPPDTCPSCGGFDFSRGRAGTDRVHRQLENISKEITIVDTTTFYEMDLPAKSLVVVTDLSLIGGAVEDIRRRERLLLATRRIAAKVASVGGELHVSGSDEAIEEAQSWLTAEGVHRTWDAERSDRKTFGYPPIAWMAKVLVTGSDTEAQSIYKELQSKLPEGITLRGPFPVPFRAKSRAARQVIHVVLTGATTESALRKLLEPLARRAIIDLDPIAFFA
jgi:primosomal protein N'